MFSNDLGSIDKFQGYLSAFAVFSRMAGNKSPVVFPVFPDVWEP